MESQDVQDPCPMVLRVLCRFIVSTWQQGLGLFFFFFVIPCDVVALL